jgi:hypothetical protein
MKSICLAFSILSALSGFISAYYWYLASKVTVTPAWELEIRGDREKNIMGWVAGNMIAFTKSGSLNRRASIWTAVTIALASISSVLSAVSA